MVNYLQDVSNFKHRKAHSKRRASDYKLNIEVGRHNKLPINERNKLPLNERVCKFCNVDIEDKIHLILSCFLYDNLRKTLLAIAR